MRPISCEIPGLVSVSDDEADDRRQQLHVHLHATCTCVVDIGNLSPIQALLGEAPFVSSYFASDFGSRHSLFRRHSCVHQDSIDSMHRGSDIMRMHRSQKVTEKKKNSFTYVVGRHYLMITIGVLCYPTPYGYGDCTADHQEPCDDTCFAFCRSWHRYDAYQLW